MKWQLIETAPKDGTRILLYAPDGLLVDDEAKMHIGLWEAPDYNRGNDWVLGPNGDEHSFGNALYDVTYWMPLPEPPE